jgi:hypothetical protein
MKKLLFLPLLFLTFNGLSQEESKNDLIIDVIWENEYFTLSIIGQDSYCDDYDLTYFGEDSILAYSDLGCSIFYEKMIFSDMKLDSVSIQQSSTIFISYSITPSDGFESAIIPNLSYSSEWESIVKSDKYYKAYFPGDSIFQFIGKPTLSEAFITQSISKLNNEYVSEMKTRFLESDKSFGWEHCTSILKIMGKTKEGLWIERYLFDDQFCIQD